MDIWRFLTGHTCNSLIKLPPWKKRMAHCEKPLKGQRNGAINAAHETHLSDWYDVWKCVNLDGLERDF